jgi:glutamate-1-semialdehyde 2,1-aminomutase
LNTSSSEALRQRAKSLIPGGCHTYAKGDDQYPEQAPAFVVRGKGCHVWDSDGNEFIEYGMGLRAVTLGHAYDRVVVSAYEQMLRGTNFTRPSTIEVQCAEELLSLIDAADMVKFAKNGSDITTAAVKLARAITGRELVAICSDQPFFSVDDWFIGSTAMNSGIPGAVRNMTVKFRYNEADSVNELFNKYSGNVACVVLEAETTEPPANNFLHTLEKACKDNGALFILDEMITGFRWHNGGAQKYYGITPDLSAFGKAMANGFSVSALAGKKEIMRLGGFDHDQERVFLLSTTHGAETHSLAAAIETMRIYKREDVVGFLDRQGSRLAHGIERLISEYRLSGYFGLMGKPCNLTYFTCDEEKNRSQYYRTLFLAETIKRGVLAPSLVVSYSHSDADIDRTIEVIGESLYIYRKALDEGIQKYLIGRPVKPVFRRYN